MSHSDHVSERFGAHAEAYLESAVHRSGEDLTRMEMELRTHCAGAAAPIVLDLGTGGGHVAFRAAAIAAKITAYDLSPAMLAVVAREAARRGIANIETCQGSAESLPFADAHFDAVLTRFSAHHWHDVPAALAEAARVLKPRGLLLLADAVAAEWPLADSWLQTMELMRDPSHARDYRLSEWENFLATAGFVQRAVTPYRLPLEFPSWVARIGTPPPLVTALRALQAEMPEELARHFALRPDGSFSLETALIIATKA